MIWYCGTNLARPRIHTKWQESGRTMNKHRTHVLACFDHLYTTSARAKDIKGRLKLLRLIALGSRNPNHWTTRSIIRA